MAQGIPNYVGDMNYAIEVLRTFNPRNPASKQGEKEQEFLKHLLQIIQRETRLDIAWPEAIFYISPDRICHAAALAIGAVID